MSSVEMVYGVPLTLHREQCSSQELTLQEIVDKIRSTTTDFTPLSTRPPSLEVASSSVLEALRTATHVYMLRGGIIPPPAPRHQAPFLVLNRERKCFCLVVGHRLETVSIDRLKPHVGEGPVEAAQPPRRGWPPEPTTAAVVPSSTDALPSWAEVVQRGCRQPLVIQPLSYWSRGWREPCGSFVEEANESRRHKHV
jgi:hypothetical protein